MWNRSVPRYFGTLTLHCCRLLLPQELSTAGHYLWSITSSTTTSITSITTIRQLCCSLNFSKSESCRNFIFTLVKDNTCAGVNVGANSSIVQRSKSLRTKQNSRPFALTFLKSRSIYITSKMILWELYTCDWIHFTSRSVIVICAIFACSAGAGELSEILVRAKIAGVWKPNSPVSFHRAGIRWCHHWEFFATYGQICILSHFLAKMTCKTTCVWAKFFPCRPTCTMWYSLTIIASIRSPVFTWLSLFGRNQHIEDSSKWTSTTFSRQYNNRRLNICGLVAVKSLLQCFQWRRQTRGVGCVGTPCRENA